MFTVTASPIANSTAFFETVSLLKRDLMKAERKDKIGRIVDGKALLLQV
jgi:hypothetical protein